MPNPRERLAAMRESVRKDIGEKTEEFGFQFSMLMASQPAHIAAATCVSGLIVAGKGLGMSKLDLQKMLMRAWDELERFDAEEAKNVDPT